MNSNPNDFFFYCCLGGLFLLCFIVRGVMDWRARCRERARVRWLVHHGERHFAGTKWTLPRHEEHKVPFVQARSRPSSRCRYEGQGSEHGGIVIDCLGLLLCSYALLFVLWLFAVGGFAL